MPAGVNAMQVDPLPEPLPFERFTREEWEALPEEDRVSRMAALQKAHDTHVKQLDSDISVAYRRAYWNNIHGNVFKVCLILSTGAVAVLNFLAGQFDKVDATSSALEDFAFWAAIVSFGVALVSNLDSFFAFSRQYRDYSAQYERLSALRMRVSADFRVYVTAISPSWAAYVNARILMTHAVREHELIRSSAMNALKQADAADPK